MTISHIRPIYPEWTLADRLRKVRLTLGYTQKGMARALGVGAPAYGQWECGNNDPRDIIGVAKALEQLSGIPAAWILGLETGQAPDGGPGLPVAGPGFEPGTSGLQVARFAPYAGRKAA